MCREVEERGLDAPELLDLLWVSKSAFQAALHFTSIPGNWPGFGAS